MFMEIDLTGLNKADVLAALYNASKPQGKGFLHYDKNPMTRQEAQRHLDMLKDKYFDYLKGRVMKIDLNSDVLRSGLYDRDNGEGAAHRVITELRKTGQLTSLTIENIHKRGTRVSADEVRAHINEESKVERDGVFTTLSLGFYGMKDALEESLSKIDPGGGEFGGAGASGSWDDDKDSTE